jgi:predicted nucleic acid-binding protein
MTRVLLDTSAYRQLLRNHLPLQAALENAEAIVFNPVIIGEILCGFAKGGNPRRNQDYLEDFLVSKHVSTVEIDRATAESYAFIYTYLSRAGTPVSPNDLWIAATAMQHNLRILTFDRDFLRIPQVMVECFDSI